MITVFFGLIHGLGFASSIAEVGIPQDRLWQIILSFNLGVELGQLAVAFGILGLFALAKLLFFSILLWFYSQYYGCCSILYGNFLVCYQGNGNMKFAIPLSMLPMDEIKPLGIAADEIGYDFLAVSDHLIHPENFSVPYPYTDDGSVRWEQGTDWPDPINSLSFLAGATKNIRFYTSVYVLPARNPLRVAKEVSTLDAVSNGRFDLGIGMGWMPEEFEAGGQEFRRRGARADEMLEIMKLLWSGEMVEFKGQFFNFKKLEMLPAPKKDIPIYVGGFSEPALNRAARHDGWISDMHSLSELEALMAKLNVKRQELPPKDNYEYICFSCWDAFSLEGFGQMKDLGVTTMTTYPWMLYGTMNDAPLEKKIEGMEKFYNEIICKLK